ncbi:MAG: HU family DNA-binding protein [Sporichthyaceae bacterium]|nr:HU family DNA-binding protein [Sporichthyaceae bacterium]
MNKAQLIDKLSSQLGSKKSATEAVEAVIDTVTRAVASGERVAITGFGVFEKVARPARTGRNPRTGATVRIKKTSVPKFKAGQSFKDVVSGAKKLPKATASAAKTAASRSTATKSTTKKSTAKKSSSARTTGSTSSAGRTLATKRSAPTAKKAAAKKLASKSTARKAPARKR